MATWNEGKRVYSGESVSGKKKNEARGFFVCLCTSRRGLIDSRGMTDGLLIWRHDCCARGYTGIYEEE